MAETVRRVVVPGVPVNRLATHREERVWAAPPHPLPMRADWGAPAPPLTYHQRVMNVTTPRQTVSRAPRAPARVSGAQQRRARQLERLTQRMLAAQRDCSRSAIAEAERGRRAVLPNVEAWVEAVLRAHGEWDAGRASAASHETEAATP